MAGSVTRQNVCQAPAPSVAAACSCSSPISCSTGATSRTTNGIETKIVARTMPGTEKMIWMPVVGEPRPEPARAAVEQQQRETDHDRRDRERQVDQRVEQPLAGEAPAHERQRREHAEDGVERDA